MKQYHISIDEQEFRQHPDFKPCGNVRYENVQNRFSHSVCIGLRGDDARIYFSASSEELSHIVDYFLSRLPSKSSLKIQQKRVNNLPSNLRRIAQKFDEALEKLDKELK